MPDLIDHLFREPPGFKPPGPSPWAEMPLWRVLAWDGFWWSVAMQWFAWPARPRTGTGVLLGAMGVVGVVHAAIIAVVWKIGPYFEPVKTFVGRHIH